MNFERLKLGEVARTMAGGWLLWAAFTLAIGLIAWAIVSLFAAIGLEGDLIDLVSCVAALAAVIWIGTKVFK